MGNQNEFKIFGRSINLVIGIAFTIIFLMGLFWITNAIFRLLYWNWFVLFLLIATLIVDYKGVVKFLKRIVNLTQRNLPVGLAAILGTAIGYPFVLIYLLGKGLLKKQINQIRKTKKEDDYIDFEEIKDDQEYLDLPEKEKKARGYDEDFFER